MKVFELHFNPKKRDDRVFGSFVYEPDLYMVGELTKILPQSNDFLNNLSSCIKNEFYNKADFSESLRKANNFLDKEAKAGNVNWLGNLNFALLNIRNSVLNFTKVGDIKILLMRTGEILDIGQNLELQDAEPYPLKVFSSIASGKLAVDDKILILTKEAFSAISQNKDFFDKVSLLSNERELKEILRINKEAFSRIAGICLLLVANGESGSSQLRIFGGIKTKILPIMILALFFIVSFLIFRILL